MYRMKVLLIFTAVVCVIVALASAQPQRGNSFIDDSEPRRQHYVKFDVQDAGAYKAQAQTKQQRGGFPPAGSFQDGADSRASSSLQQQLHKPIGFGVAGENYPNALPQINHRPQQQHLQQQQQQPLRRPSAPPQQFRQQLTEEEKELLEEDKEEPDRLSVLLPNSKFDCNSKNGYYADESLNCEVFHYCHDNAKHSWVCPEGFTFHQVHLICMPPSGDNICQKSTKFHFVNDYLYKVINSEEAESRPNVTLRYSDRYYPENYHYGENFDGEGEQEQRPAHILAQPPRRQPIQVGFQQNQQPQLIRRPAPPPGHFAPTLRPETHLVPQQFRPSGQVFHSPEEVNISLQQRRPAFLVASASQRPFPTTQTQSNHKDDDDIEYE